MIFPGWDLFKYLSSFNFNLFQNLSEMNFFMFLYPLQISFDKNFIFIIYNKKIIFSFLNFFNIHIFYNLIISVNLLMTFSPFEKSPIFRITPTCVLIGVQTDYFFIMEFIYQSWLVKLVLNTWTDLFIWIVAWFFYIIIITPTIYFCSLITFS